MQKQQTTSQESTAFNDIQLVEKINTSCNFIIKCEDLEELQEIKLLFGCNAARITAAKAKQVINEYRN